MIKFNGVPNSLKDNVHEYKTYPIFLAELLQRSPVLVGDPEPLGVTGTDVHVHLVSNLNLGIEEKKY